MRASVKPKNDITNVPTKGMSVIGIIIIVVNINIIEKLLCKEEIMIINQYNSCYSHMPCLSDLHKITSWVSSVK